MAKALKDALRTYTILNEKINSGEESIENPSIAAELEDAKTALIEQCKTVLSPKIIVANSALSSLHSGELSVMDAISSGALDFDYNLDDDESIVASELFSLVTVDLADSDPGLATLIIQAIARQKIDAVLGAAPAAKAAPKKLPRVLPPEEDLLKEGKKVTERALSLRRSDETGLIAYIAGNGVSTYAAAEALYELATVDPVQAERVLHSLPNERIEEMTIGHATIGKTGVLGMVNDKKAVQLVQAQLKNDRSGGHGEFSDMNNMTAASLVMLMIEERQDPLGMLALLIGEEADSIDWMISEKVDGADAERSKGVRAELAEYWLQHEDDVMERLAEMQFDEEHAPTEEIEEESVVAPQVNLDKPVDLDDL